ncbi:MAG: Nif11-like leader peptide family natural product precursor [Synergistaceae bacterium]|jgi:predicted ribosomally synthesized peptide with nif11-like leader|nr:Nif11-like leader peptide family natural product precursor [Synergistaceae bacterium]
MSVEAAKGFLAKLSEDKEFAEKLNAIQSDEGCLKMAKDFGFDFTNEELKLCVVSTGELSDDDLEKVAGGISIGDIVGGFTGLSPKIINIQAEWHEHIKKAFGK